MMVSTRCSSEQGDTSCREEPKGYNVTTSMSRSCNNKRGGFGLPLSITGLFAAPHHRLITACIFACTFVAYWERLGFSIAFTEVATDMKLSETEKGAVFAAFYYGYSITPIPGGYLAKKYGGKAILALSFLLWAPVSSLTALATGSVQHVVAGVVACRVFIGLAQGMFLPAAHNVLGHWIPSTQRGRHFAFAMAGMYAGATIAMVTVPYMIVRVSAPTVFHVAAGLAICWLVLWGWTGSDAPSADTQSEERDVEGGMSEQVATMTDTSEDTEERRERDRIEFWSAAGFLALTPRFFSFRNAASWRRGSSPGSFPPVRPPQAKDALQEPGNQVASWDVSVAHKTQETTSPRRSRVLNESMGTCTAKSGCSREDRVGAELNVTTVSLAPACATAARYLENQREEVPKEGPDGFEDILSPVSSISSDGADILSVMLSNSSLRFSSTHGSGAQLETPHGSPPRLNRLETRESIDGSTLSNEVISDKDVEKTRRFFATEEGKLRQGRPTPHSTAPATPTSLSVSSGIISPADSVDAANVGGRYNQTNTNESSGAIGISGSVPSCVVHDPMSDMRSSSSSSNSITPIRVGSGSGNVRESGRERGNGGERCHIVSTNIMCYSSADKGRLHTGFPWKAMLCSSPAWACVAGNVGCSTGVSVVMSWQPTYFREFLGVDLDSLGLVNQLSPYLTMLVFSVLGGVLYTRLVNEHGFSKALASKLITTGALFIALGAFLAMGLATSAITGTLLISGALAALAVSRGGWSTNHAEIAAPEHGSMLFSIANCISSITSVMGISLTGKLLDAFGGAKDPGAWMAAMGMVGVVCGVCGAFYAITAGGDRVLFPSSQSVEQETAPRTPTSQRTVELNALLLRAIGSLRNSRNGMIR